MDWQTIFMAATGVATSIVGWFVREIQKDIEAATRKQDEDSRKIASLQLDVAKNYVTHADLSDIKDSLLRIEDKLDRKQDRDHSPRAN
mgnify:CR=1 FL=1